MCGAGRVEPAGRVLLGPYDLRTPELIPWAGGQAHEVIGAEGFTVMRSAPVVDEHAGPQLVVVAEVNAGWNLALYVELAPGVAQDELLARAYFGDGPIGTSIRMSDDPRRTRVDKGRVPQVTRRGVTVLHLAFCTDPMRDSAVQRADLPTTPPASRGARDVHGVVDAPQATRAASVPDGAVVVGPGEVMTRYGLSRWSPPRGARVR